MALKEIRPDRAANPEIWRRFLKEAQITGQLEHPNIVPVYELARRREDDQPFYTMRFVRGQSLRGAIEEFHRRRAGKAPDRLALQSLLGAFLKVCDAIAYAHSRGVVHRDLKPENVVLGGFGEVVVLDWGLAKLVDVADEGDRGERRDGERISVSAEASDREDSRPAGHSMLHGTRASRAEARPDRRPNRRLRPGRHPLRDPDRPSARGRSNDRRSPGTDPYRARPPRPRGRADRPPPLEAV